MDRAYYPLADAAERLHCSPQDVLHLAATRKIRLLIGVPERIDVDVFDESTQTDFDPFLFQPQFLVLSQSQAVKLETLGSIEASDFPDGYVVESDGQVQRLPPHYGRPYLNRRDVCWRLQRDGRNVPLAFAPEHIFVLARDIGRIERPELPAEAPTPSDGILKSPTESKDASDQQPELKQDAQPAKALQAILKESATFNQSPEPTFIQPHESAAKEYSIATILRVRQVMAITGLSRSTIYDKMNQKSRRYDPDFPKQIHLGENLVGWEQIDIEAWINSKKQSKQSPKH